MTVNTSIPTRASDELSTVMMHRLSNLEAEMRQLLETLKKGNVIVSGILSHGRKKGSLTLDTAEDDD